MLGTVDDVLHFIELRKMLTDWDRRRKNGESDYPRKGKKKRERELKSLLCMQILRHSASSAPLLIYSRFTRVRIVFFGGHAALSSADRISNDDVRTRVRLCFARGRKPALKSPNDRRTIAKRVRQFKNDLMSIQKIDVKTSFIVTNFIRCVCWNKFPKRL